MCLGTAGLAQDVQLTQDRAAAQFVLNDRPIIIQRIQDTDNQLTGEFSRTSRACPPHCIQPMIASAGVSTIGELETIAFLESIVASSGGLLIDSRLPAEFSAATIPGAVNVPATALAPDNPYLNDILMALGAQSAGGGSLSFFEAMDLAVFGAGPWSDDASRTIDYLLAAGYPAAKLRYYRGGMQSWQSLGLSLAPLQNGG